MEIIIDASQLDYFQLCPRKWKYSYEDNLVPKFGKNPFRTGSFWHEALAHYYTLYKDAKEEKANTKVDYALTKTLEFMKGKELRENYKITDEELKFHLHRMTAYNLYYLDEQIEILAVEQGFSYLLYESNDRRYIMEGKIDLIAKYPETGLTVTDHKTQSRFEKKWPLNNQLMNYCNFVKPEYFMYNYIGLQDKIGLNTFCRQIYKVWPGMLEEWVAETKVTLDTLYENLIDEEFPKRRAACSGKYGVCAYHKLCSVPDNSKWQPVVLSAYEKKKEKWIPWK